MERQEREREEVRVTVAQRDGTPLNPGGEMLCMFSPDNECVGNSGEYWEEVGVRGIKLSGPFLGMCERGRQSERGSSECSNAA